MGHFGLDDHGPMWQYANMAHGQIVYIRRVANDTEAPNRIRELREAIGLSQAELARRVNCDSTTLNKVENGKRGLDLDWMMRLAPALTTADRPVAPADLLPRSANPYLLDQDERRLIDARREAPEMQRDTFQKVAEAMLPFRGEDDDRQTA